MKNIKEMNLEEVNNSINSMNILYQAGYKVTEEAKNIMIDLINRKKFLERM